MTDNAPAPLAFVRDAPTRRDVNVWWKGDGKEERLFFSGPFAPNGDWIGCWGMDGDRQIFYSRDGDPLARMFHHVASLITELAVSGNIGWLEQEVGVSVATDRQMRKCRVLTFSPWGSPSDGQVGNPEKWAVNICSYDEFQSYRPMQTIPARPKHYPERLAQSLRVAYGAAEKDLRSLVNLKQRAQNYGCCLGKRARLVRLALTSP